MSIAAVASRHSLALFTFQEASFDPHDLHLLMIFVGIAAISILFLALVVLAALVVGALGAAKARAGAQEAIAEFKAKAYPVFEKSHTLITDLTPTIKNITVKTDSLITSLSPKIDNITGHVETIAGHAEEISLLVKDKLHEFSPSVTAAKETFDEANATVRDVNQKTQEQVVRVNGIVTSVLDKTNELVDTVHRGIRTPAREVAGVVTGLKAGIDSLLHRTRGFGAGFTPNPTRKPAPPTPAPTPTPKRSSYPVPPRYTPAESSAAAATEAFNKAEKPDLGL